jgi:tetratricopeptide (TPR) repeat protein
VAAAGEETFWAVRKLVEALARERPLVLVFEDVHWAEPTLLDLVEHLARWIREAPVLLVCLARPELLELRPGWSGGALNATSILLEPLSGSESADLAKAFAGDLGERERGRAVATAQGNPLFLEQTLALLAEDGDTDGARTLPPAIQVLLAARLDRLPSEQRRLVGCAAVEGESFHVGAVAVLSGLDLRRARSGLDELVAKELVRPGRPTLAGEDAFRFGHALVRDAAYESLPKEERARLHERYADWLEQTLGESASEGEEFLGYHLEQAWRYREALGEEGEHLADLALRAGSHLDVAARRALARADLPAAIGLLDRALELLPETSAVRLGLMPELAYALLQVGPHERSEAVAAAAIEAARKASDRRVEWHAAVIRTVTRMYVDPGGVELERVRAEAEEAAAVFELLDDDLGRARLGQIVGEMEWLVGHVEVASQADETALFYARRAGSRQDEVGMFGALGWGLAFGPAPVGEARERYARALPEAGRDHTLESLASLWLAVLDGLEGRAIEAEARLARARAGLVEVGLGSWVEIADLIGGRVAALAGDLALAEQRLRAASETFARDGNRWLERVAEVVLLRVVHEQGRDEEAFELGKRLESMPVRVGVPDEMILLSGRGVVLAARGRLDEAEPLAREAVGLAATTDVLDFHGDVLVDLATILHLDRRDVEAVSALEEAIGLYERKGNVVSAAKARGQLDMLRAR